MRKKSGVILISVLWILLLLSLFAFGMGRVSAGEMSLLKISMGRLKAYAAARSGVLYAEGMLLKKPSNMDRWGMNGVALVPEEQKKTFSHIALEDGTFFDVGMPVALLEGASVKDAKDMAWGVVDETGRFNINMVDQASGVGALVFKNFIEEILPGEGERLTEVVSRYRFAEQEKIQLHTFHFLEELMLLEGFSADVFKKVKPFLTVYPYKPQKGFSVNIYTASPALVRAVFKGAAEFLASASSDSLQGAETFLACRKEAADKGTVNVFCSTPGYVAGVLTDGSMKRSGIYRIRSVGIHPESKMRSVVETVVVVSGKELKELAWHRE